jgi:hypothetical protein
MEDWIGFPFRSPTSSTTSRRQAAFKQATGGFYVCQLCSRDGDDEPMHQAWRKGHAVEVLHQTRAHKLREERDAVLALANATLRQKRRREAVPVPVCPAMEAAICRHIFFDDPSSLAEAEPRIRNVLKASEPNRGCGWTSRCGRPRSLCQLRPTRRRSLFTLRSGWSDWLSRGWKALKDGACVGGDSLTRYDAPLMGITPLVAPLLGGPKREGGQDPGHREERGQLESNEAFQDIHTVL